MALREAALLGIILLFSGHIHSVFTVQNVCKTYGSGVFSTFNRSVFHLKSSCPVMLTHFTHAGVDCHIMVQRAADGLMDRLEIIVNKVTTLVYNNTVTVEGKRISLPYDHTYQHVFHYGVYTRLKSKVLPLSVTWYSVSNGVSSLWVQLDQDLIEDMSGLCGHKNSSETQQQLISTSVLSDGQCLTQDSVAKTNTICNDVLSHTYECLGAKYSTYRTLCYKNMNGLWHQEANCSFFSELALMCGTSSPLWSMWRSKAKCPPPVCPGDMRYYEMGPAFPPTCSNPQNYTKELTRTCLPADGKVVNDRVEGYHSIHVEDCPCVHSKIMYTPGQERRTKCQTCTCVSGKWACSPNTCPAKCTIEGQFITTFDGKQYSLLDRCTFVAARGLNWTLNVQYSGQTVTVEKAYLNINQEKYTFSANSIQLNNIEISDLSQTESATVFWQSSMFIQVQTSFGLKMQVQVSPEIQLYLNLPPSENTKGLCGTYNNDTSDDFTTFSGIIESSVQLFSQSWSMGSCTPNMGCINTENEIFAEANCEQLKDPEGVFAVCHDYVPVARFLEACVQKTCQCSSALQECLCVSFGNYAKACATQGVTIENWRSETNCPLQCMGNLRFSYAMLACNHTCRSLSGFDPTCDVRDDPVEGCGCASDSHLSNPQTCTPRSLCTCHHPGGAALPGPVVIGGRQCLCENGQLHCPKICNCTVGKICVDCSQIPVNTVHRTCESLTKPVSDDSSCISGCYCPDGLFEDHNGRCVTHNNCTCEFSGRVYETGESVETNCKLCTCRGGEWSCVDEECSGVCEVFGNGQYRTFDSKWYRFDGHCQYTLVKDGSSGQFAIKTESVPCCDESLTCSRAISVELLGVVTLTMSDMKVTERIQTGDALMAEPLYSIHTVGLYIIISVQRLGITVIWDKHTRLTIQLESWWRSRVLGLCGNFDGKVTNDLTTSSSSEVFSVLDFGNSWKTATPPCSDVTTEIFPCERHSYCAAWAQRRCMILKSDTFTDCHLKVDPEPYYQACVLESCSCEFEGKFLGFCTAVSAYAEACSAKDVCINWRTPDLCPVYCDYYNEVGQCTWHYNPCGQVMTCGTNYRFTGKLEGCYPRCPDETPYYDENTGKCTTLDNCTCNFMNRLWSTSDEMCTQDKCCKCLGGQIVCTPTTTTTYYTSTPTTTMAHTTTTQQPTTERTTTATTPPSTSKSTTEDTSTTEGKTTTTRPSTSKSTTEHTSTTQQPTTVRTTTTTPQSTSKSTTTTQPSTAETTTEQTTTTQPPTTERTTTTTQPSTAESTTEHTTTTQPSTVESTTEYTTTTTTAQPSTTEGTTEYTSTTEQLTLETTTEYTTTTQPSTVETTSEYTTPPTTSTQPSTTEGTTEYTSTLETTTGYTTTTQLSTVESTTGYTTTTQTSTAESTTEYTTTTQPPTTERTTTRPSTSESTTEYTTTTQPSTVESTTEYTTTTQPPTTERRTTRPATSESTTEYTATTQPSTVESTTEYTSTTQPPTTERTTTRLSTSQSTTEYTATTQPSTVEGTTEYTATTQPSTVESTTEYTATTQPSTVESTTEYTTTTQPSTAKSTTEYTTTTTTTTTTQPSTTEGTTEYTTTTQPSTVESTTDYTTTTTTTQPSTTETTMEYTTTQQSTSERTATTRPSTSESTTEYTTITETSTAESTTEYTTTTQPSTTERTTTTTSRPSTSESTTEYTTTTQPSTSESTTEYTTTTTSTQPSTVENTTGYTKLQPTTESTTKSYTTPMEKTTTTQLPTTESTTESKITTLLTSQSTTQPPTTPKVFTTTTEASTSVTYSTAKSTVSTTGFTVVTGPELTSPSNNSQVYSTTTMTTTSTPFVTPGVSTTIPTLTPTLTPGVSTTIPTLTPTVTPGVSTTIPTLTPTVTPTTTPFMTTVLNTTIPTTEHPECMCKDVMRNKTWSCGETWRENCADKVCEGGIIMVKPITCPESEYRTDCPQNKMSWVKDEETCCESWKCDCQCQIYGDPHYISFEGIAFDFMENCTYTLVEETVLNHRLSITVDNYFCVPDVDNSCSRGISLQYWNDSVTLMVTGTEEFTVEPTLNQEIIKPPYENQVFKFESSAGQVFVYIKPIRSYVSLTPFNTLVINLATEHFQNNTQGQCGVCGGPSCIRRNGVVEGGDCCDKTAYSWVVEDPMKPYCNSVSTNIPCVPTTKSPPPPPPPPPTPPCNPPLCDLLHHEVFAECGKWINLTSVENNCQFDVQSFNSCVGACSSLEYAASECKRIGICVDWRYLTNHTCEITCPEGMIYDECRETPNDVCRGGARLPATSVAGLRSGCFCPDGQMLAEDHKQICVSECTTCKGPLGEPMPVGSVWESNCHICTCNNQTRTEECVRKPPNPTPVCSVYSVLVSDCCDNQICVEKNCEYNGKTYKVGDRWTDPSRPCASFGCSQTGIEIEKIKCPMQNCPEDLRVWDRHHCCYSCNVTCAARMTRMNVTVANCTQEVQLPVCEGQCETHNSWIHTNGTLELQQSRQCCQETTFEMRQIALTCNKSSLTHFTYRHVTGCRCKAEG